MTTKTISRLALTLMTGTVLFFGACKKDKDNNSKPDPIVTKKITRVEQDANNYLDFSYNTDGTLKKVVIATNEDGDPFVKAMNLSYGDNKKISKITIDGAEHHIAYIYEDGKLTKTEVRDDKNFVLSSGSFYYENGRLMNYGEFQPFPFEDGSDGINYKRVMEVKYTYTNDGNIQTLTTNLRNPLTDQLEKAGSHVYENFDGKKNPMSAFPELALGLYQENNKSNLLNEKHFDEKGKLTETITRTYTYDSNGYPLTSTEKTVENGQTTTKNFKFTYQ